MKRFFSMTQDVSIGLAKLLNKFRPEKVVSIILMICLLSLSIPAAPQLVVNTALRFRQDVVLLISLNSFFSEWTKLFKTGPQQETQEERNANVVRVEIVSKEKTVSLGRQVAIGAHSYDRDEIPVGGVKLNWKLKTPEGYETDLLDGNFIAEKTGQYQISAQLGGLQDTATITVVEQKDLISQGSKETLDGTQFAPPPPFDEWNINNIPHAKKLKNLRGEHAGKPKGKNNYNISAPVLSMPGRGLGLELGLFYNSNVWSQLDQDVSFDMDRDWVSPGWSLGFGKIINMVGGGIVQVDGNGSKRYFAGTVTVNPDSVYFDGQTTDGTFIKTHTETSGINVPNVGPCFYNPITFLKYPDGTTVKYDRWSNPNVPTTGCFSENTPITMVPINVTDRNGNTIEIVYHQEPSAGQPQGKWIDYITDSLGREYTFNYELVSGKYYLSSITGSGFRDANNQMVIRTFVRLGYKNHTVSHNFNGLTPHVREANIRVLSSIYYPATQSGYWFGETDSYSPYGMIHIVREQKGMGYSQQNGITAGQTTRTRTYSYPDNTTSAISDIPLFTTVTETWEGMTTAPNVSEYQVSWDANPRTTTIISADGTKIIEYSLNLTGLPDTDPEKVKDGLTYKTERYDSIGVLRAKEETEWEPGYQVSSSAASAVPRPKKMTQTMIENGVTLTKGILNDSFGEYNQVLESREFGYGGETDILRKTVSSYIKKGDSPTGFDQLRALPRLINLPDTVQVYDQTTSTRIAYSKNFYDVNALRNLSGSYPDGFCHDTYCLSVTERGNVTKTVTYENAADLTGEVSNNNEYDKVGNLVYQYPENSGSITAFSKYTLDTQYAFPQEVITGTFSGSNPQTLQVKSTATYNFETGLTLTVTDPYQQTAQILYDVNTWRTTRINSPTGAYGTFGYDDLNRAYSRVQYDSGSISKAKSVTKINGLGLPYRKENLATVTNVGGQPQEIWDVVEIEYDQFSRQKKVSNPFRNNESAHGVYWSETFYDTAGRVWKTVSPNGGTKFNYYNESTRPQGASSALGESFRVKDPIGREKWYLTDVDGNMVQVVEPDPQGTGAVATNGLVTNYFYDKFGLLTKTQQGVQQRDFRYDSLGRLTHQKMIEAKATLDATGNFVGENIGLWTDVYTYDKASNITSRTDARGVKAIYSYVNPSRPEYAIDPLNRLFSISYNTNGAADVLASPTVNFNYRTSGDFTDLSSLVVQGISTTTLGYDSLGRVNQKETTLNSRPSNPITFNYSYDSLGRGNEVVYPTPFGMANTTRKTIHYDFDDAGKMSALKVDGVNYASGFIFNANDQVTSVKVGPSGTNQITETYNYNAQSGLLENQQVLRGAASLLDLSYEYQQCSCSTGGSGQIKKITNNLDRNKDRYYDYDALARLTKVTGGVNQGWSQAYAYDRYGNRTSVTARGFEARQAENGEDNSTDKSTFPSLLAEVEVPTAGKLLDDVRNLPKITDPAKENKEFDNRSKDSKSETRDDASNLTIPGKPFDFDNDGKADFSIFNKQTNNWELLFSGNGQTYNQQFGSNGDHAAPADYDGDGKTDIAVWRPSTGVWYIQRSSDGGFTIRSWGLAGDTVVPADYDGDNKADIAVWRPSNGGWYIVRSSDGGVTGVVFGGQHHGDVPVPADYDGDSRADIAIWRPATGAWWTIQSSNGQVIAPQFGITGDVPVPAKYDSDAKADLAVWRPSTGTWYASKSTNGGLDTVAFGAESLKDVLVPADYDGDGKTDYAIWRPGSGTWYVLRSTDGGATVYNFGSNGNLAVPSVYVRRTSAPKNQSAAIPTDGIAAITYDTSTNRITNTGYTYDYAGNQTRMVREDGVALRFQYDAAGRMVKVKNDNSQTLITYTYGESRERLISQEGDESSANKTYYAWEGGAVVSEYTDSVSSTLVWAKNYIYLGGSLLATQEKNGSGEKVQFDHADSLGTRIITDPGAGTSFEQMTMPFGTALDNESSGSVNQRFTSYDRSVSTGLDYAVNRFYDSKQGRFTQVDPVGMASSSLKNPQSLNLYAYTENDPINKTDPDGLDSTYSLGGVWIWWPGGQGAGSSQSSGIGQYLNAIIMSFFGSNPYSVAGMTVGFHYASNPQAMMSATDRYGLHGMGTSRSIDPMFQDEHYPTVKDIYQKRPEISECDKFLANFFSDLSSYFAVDWDYAGKGENGYANWRGTYWSQDAKGKWIFNDGAHLGSHLYFSRKATDGNANIYVPTNAGWHSPKIQTDSSGNSFVLIHFAKLGPYKNVTLAVIHIQKYTWKVSGGRIKIGLTGGAGAENVGPGSIPHAHLELWQGLWKGFPANAPNRKILDMRGLCPK